MCRQKTGLLVDAILPLTTQNLSKLGLVLQAGLPHKMLNNKHQLPFQTFVRKGNLGTYVSVI
jgi:hypothetical protein